MKEEQNGKWYIEGLVLAANIYQKKFASKEFCCEIM